MSHEEPWKGSSAAARAKEALENVCSGAHLSAASEHYSPTFVDHVNDVQFHGLAGVERSVRFYRSLFSEMAITVTEQLVDGDRVVSRFVVTGTCRGRGIRFNGITISRFEHGLIVEDWSVTDSLGMIRQLGIWRTIRVALAHWRATRPVRS
jgi:predicted ester cyclase